MKSLTKHHGRIPFALILCTILLTIGCSSTRMVAVVRPQKTRSEWKNRIKVYIRFSSKSLLENRIAVINASRNTVGVYPVDIRLEIPEAGITLPAVIDFKEYVGMRYQEAGKQCSEATNPKRCSRYVTRFFKRYEKVKAFRFGEIPSRKKQTGYFAFNLPDPFNESTQSKRAKKLLKGKEHILDGTIRVVVNTIAFEPRQHEFTFPVKVITSTDEKPKLLRIMKYF